MKQSLFSSLCRLAALMLALLTGLSAAALAEPLTLLEDYANDVVMLYEESDPSAGKFSYSYRYPHVDVNQEGGAEIDVFYADLAAYTDSFTIPMNMDAFEDSDNLTEIRYQITCNNDDYFSVLVETARSSAEQTFRYWEGHVFSRKNGSPGLTWTLPRLLGILDQNESDTWLQDRQTSKADALLIDMVWEKIRANQEGIDYFTDLTREDLSHFFFPEENFYLDENGNPVFFLQPGLVAPESVGLLTYGFSLEEILDEL